LVTLTDESISEGSEDEEIIADLGIRKASRFDDDGADLDEDEKSHRERAMREYVIRATRVPNMK
jgi:hypothetical protein